MTVPTELFRRLTLRALGLAALLALGACGGGDREVEYKPTRLIVFGDEVSYIEPADVPASGAVPRGGSPSASRCSPRLNDKNLIDQGIRRSQNG